MTWPALSVEANPCQLVTQSITNYEKDWRAALDFNYIERDVSRNSSNQTRSVDFFQVNVIDGTPYKRLIARDGHPLDVEEARKEAERYQKTLDTRDKETAEQRARRIRKYDDEREFLKEIPDAFNMKLLGQETLNGRPNWVVQMTPKAGYIPVSKYARIFPDIEGKLWIDQEDIRWTKAIAKVTDTISFGWVLARIGPGAEITMLQQRVGGGHWMPEKIEIDGVAKILLVKNRTIDETVTYENYKPIHPVPTITDAKNR